MSDTQRIVEYIQRSVGLANVRSMRASATLEARIALVCEQNNVTQAQLLERLHHDERLVADLAGLATVGESYFLRHAQHFRYIVAYCQAAVASGSTRERLTLWSAGCASGEEPYSIAATLHHSFGDAWATHFRIVACDVDGAAIERARAARYGSWSFRGVPSWFLGRYFQMAEDQGGCMLDASLQGSVTFASRSIQAFGRTLAANSVRVILFRNVGIYLRPETLAEIYQLFARVLHNDGLLLISPADRVPGRKLFRPSDADPSVLQKTLNRGRRAGRLKPGWADAHGASIEAGRVDQASENATPTSRARLLDEALSKADLLVKHEPTSKAAWLLRGQIRLLKGYGADASQDFHKAVFLDPFDPVARFWYAMALEQAGRVDDVFHQLAVVREDLVRRPPEVVLNDETSVADLLASVATLERKVRTRVVNPTGVTRKGG